MVVIKCKYCGKEFEAQPSAKRKFCSMVCKDKNQIGGVGHWRGKKRLNMSKERNPNWSGDNIGYGGIHIWLVKKFGKADKCEFCKCEDSPRFEWALLNGCKHERKRENYIKLCKKCHNDYDGVNAWQQG